ncbi:hypothetical protein EYF80_000120 [Liparis tanakae]|uniref:Uncharacterized protein n=1 Tax=Liparis tanakae TaxID=230148 RepID=A0A4Z2JHS9_9TELE|nr:hypothetical protein EYF80_000120 [Liparis tanakae]
MSFSSMQTKSQTLQQSENIHCSLSTWSDMWLTNWAFSSVWKSHTWQLDREQRGKMARIAVSRQMSRKRLLSAEHFAADGAGEELLAESPRGHPVSRLAVLLFRVWNKTHNAKVIVHCRRN